MIIITRRTIDEDLKEFGYPNGPCGYIVQSSSGFINKDLFKEYLKEIIIHWVIQKRKLLGDDNAIAGIILDGCTSHIDDSIFEFGNKNGIIFYKLPAHSSHITQPLDQLIFTLWKQRIKKTKTEKDLTIQSKRIYIASKCLMEVCTHFNIISSFSKSGIIIQFDGYNPKTTTNVEKLFKLDYSPNEQVNSEEVKKKVSRIKVLSSKNEKEKKLENFKRKLNSSSKNSNKKRKNSN